MRRIRRLVGLGLLAAAVAVWVVALRPQALGGPALYIVVRGDSMLPTYQSGDLVVVQSAAAYSVGDVIAYRVPRGEIGEDHIVIHRISGGDGGTGFAVKGDNNPAVDPWSPRMGEIAGTTRWVVPGLGRLIAFAHQPIIAGALAAALMVTLIMSRPSSQTRGGQALRRAGSSEDAWTPSAPDRPTALAVAAEQVRRRRARRVTRRR